MSKKVKIGSKVIKPIDLDEYAAMAAAVDDHNEAAAVGDMLWVITETDAAYVVSKYGIKPDETEQEISDSDRIAALEAKVAELIAKLEREA